MPRLHTAQKCFIWKRARTHLLQQASSKDLLAPVCVLLHTAVPDDLPSALVMLQGESAAFQPLFLAACSVSAMLSSKVVVSCTATKSAAVWVTYSAAVFQQLPLTVSKAQCP